MRKLEKIATLFIIVGFMFSFAGCSVKKVPPTYSYYLSQETSGITNSSVSTPVIGSLKLAFTLPSRVSESTSIYYIDKNYKQQSYNYSRWYDTVTTMFEAKLLRAIENSGIAKSVTGSTTAVDAEVILEIGILDFVHDLNGGENSKGSVCILATLINNRNGKTVATKLFEAAADAEKKNAQGAVAALNKAADDVTVRIIDWLKTL